jgi:isopentenyl diphosphate isomerase/L-lactate dehydrogenase-like FMN-dependent dehydrogenase
MSADMGENLPFLVIGPKKPDDVAMAIGTIQIVVVVQNDVLRTFDLTPTNQGDVPKPIVHGV